MCFWWNLSVNTNFSDSRGHDLIHISNASHVPSNEVMLLTECCKWQSNTVMQCFITVTFLKLLKYIFLLNNNNILSKSPWTQETKATPQMNMLLETKNNGKIWKITFRGNSWWRHFVHLYLHTQPHGLPTHKHPVSLKTAMEVAGIIKKLGHLLCMGHGSPSPYRRLGRLLTGGYQRHRTGMLGCK